MADFARISQGAPEGRKDGDRIAQEATEALKKAESLVRGYEKRLFDLTGRLKGAQQKATRFKQKALLMTGETQAPGAAETSPPRPTPATGEIDDPALELGL